MHTRPHMWAIYIVKYSHPARGVQPTVPSRE